LMLQVLRKWMWLQRTQWMSSKQLSRIQTKQLRHIVTHAYQNVLFYNQVYKRVNVSANNISKVTDISKIPSIARTDLQRAPLQERTAANADVASCSLSRSSGTTGMPVEFLEDPFSAAWREALMLRFLLAYGVRPFDRIGRARFWGSAPARPSYLGEKQGLWGFIRRKVVRQQLFVDFAQQYDFLSRSKPDVLAASMYYSRGLARYCESAGKQLKFRMILTAGEILDDSTRKLIADSFEAEVFDNYGIEEVGGSIAWECPSHAGYHVNAESLLVELLRNGEPVQAGEIGDLYVTCFHRKATPIIRYATGDRARYVKDACPCGRGLPLIREIQGRVMDFILTTDGRQVSPHMVLRTLTDIVGLEQFKVNQNEDLSIQIRIRTESEKREAAVKQVQRRCKDLFGEIPLEIMEVEEIGVSEKYRVVESRATPSR